jgi:hypothetical protein
VGMKGKRERRREARTGGTPFDRRARARAVAGWEHA